MAAEGPGIIRQAMPALTRASAAQNHITSRKLKTNDDWMEDSIADAAAGSTPRGTVKAASLLSFDRNSARALAGIPTVASR